MKLKFNSSLDLRPVAEILNNHGLSAGGDVQKHMANQLMRIFDPYVPLRSGVLKSSVKSDSPYTQITYDGPYAARLYHKPQYNFNQAPRRGAYWATRAYADNKDVFINDLQNYVRERH